jgi:hypothetical protein
MNTSYIGENFVTTKKYEFYVIQLSGYEKHSVSSEKTDIIVSYHLSDYPAFVSCAYLATIVHQLRHIITVSAVQRVCVLPQVSVLTLFECAVIRNNAFHFQL